MPSNASAPLSLCALQGTVPTLGYPFCVFKVSFYNPCGPFEFSAARSFERFPKRASPKRLAFDVKVAKFTITFELFMLWHPFFARVKVDHRSIYSRILARVCAVAMVTGLI